MSITPEKWSEKLSTGIIWQDMQHKELVTKLNELYEAIIKKHDTTTIKETIKFLDKYVIDHFGTEEKYMTEYDFPEAEEHIKEHHNFIKDYDLLKDYYENPTELSATVLCFDLNQWLATHIRETDLKLGVFLKSRV